MKQEIENIIKKNLPEKKEITCDLPDIIKMCKRCEDDIIFNQSLSQINTSLIADEVLKVVVEKIDENIMIEQRTHRIGSHSDDWGGESDLPCDCDEKERNYKIKALQQLKTKLLSNLSPNKENEK